MEEIKMINAQELLDNYDEIINITMVNLYTLTKEKEIIMCVVKESLLDDIKLEIENRFNVSSAAKGVMIVIDLLSIAGVSSYKFISDYEGSKTYGKKE